MHVARDRQFASQISAHHSSSSDKEILVGVGVIRVLNARSLLGAVGLLNGLLVAAVHLLHNLQNGAVEVLEVKIAGAGLDEPVVGDGRARADVRVAREDELIEDDELRPAVEEGRGEEECLDVILEGDELILCGEGHADLREEAAEDGAADVVAELHILGAGLNLLHANAALDAEELAVNRGGLRHAAGVDVVGLAPVGGVLALLVRVEHLKEGHVVAGLVEELPLGAHRRAVLVVRGHDEGVLNGHHRGDAADAIGALELLAGHDHSRHLRLQGELGEAGAIGREVTVVIEGAEEVEELEGAHECLGGRGVNEVEVDKVVNAHLLHVEDNRSQVAAEDLRVRLGLEVLLEGLLRVEAEALTGAGTTGTTASLVGRGLADGGDEEGLDAELRIVHLLLGESAVDDEDDSVNGEGRLSNVGGDDNLAGALGDGAEDLALRLGREGAVEGEHLEGPILSALKAGRGHAHAAGEALARRLDFILTAKEHQNVARPLEQVDLRGGADRGLNVVSLGGLRVVQLDAEHAAGDVDEGGLGEVLLELLLLEGGGHDNDAEVGALGDEVLDGTNEDIRVDGALVGLIEYNDRVLREEGVGHSLTEEHTVGHVLNARLLAADILETNSVTDLVSEGNVHLLGDTLRHGHGGNTTGLRAGDGALGAELEEELRHLGRLTGTRLSDEEEGLVALHKALNAVLGLVDRQLLAGLEDVMVALAVGAAGVGVDVGHGCCRF